MFVLAPILMKVPKFVGANVTSERLCHKMVGTFLNIKVLLGSTLITFSCLLYRTLLCWNCHFVHVFIPSTPPPTSHPHLIWCYILLLLRWNVEIFTSTIKSTISICSLNSCYEGWYFVHDVYMLYMFSSNYIFLTCFITMFFKVKPNKVNLIIGSGGKTIKSIIEETGVDAIDTGDDGTVRRTWWYLPFSLTKVLLTNAFCR